MSTHKNCVRHLKSYACDIILRVQDYSPVCKNLEVSPLQDFRGLQHKLLGLTVFFQVQSWFVFTAHTKK